MIFMKLTGVDVLTSVGDMISQECLPEGLMARCLDVLRVLSPNERDLIRVVVEVVHELRDQGEPEKSQDLVRWSVLSPVD